MAMVPFQYEKIFVHKIFLKVKNELTFAFDDTYYVKKSMIMRIESCQFPMDSFTYLKVFLYS